MDNLLKATDFAYVAGIVDGEGCIYIGKNKPNRHRNMTTYALFVTVTNTNEWLIQWLRFSFGGSITKTVRKAKPNQKDAWTWCVAAQQGASFLRLVTPYLRVKKYQAEVALRFQGSKRPRGSYGATPRTDEEMALEEAQCILMHELNRKGKIQAESG